jgi:hypothetical protein
MADNARLAWIKEKTCKGLGVDPELFDELAQTEGASNRIAAFLDGGVTLKQAAARAGSHLSRSRSPLNISMLDAGDSALLVTLEQVTIQVEELREIPR